MMVKRPLDGSEGIDVLLKVFLDKLTSTLRVLREERALFLVGATFLLWSALPAPLQGWLLVPAWVFAVALIGWGSFEFVRLKRIAWLDRYVLESSVWHRRLRRLTLQYLLHLCLALVLSLMLLINLATVSTRTWVVLLLSTLLVVWFRRAALRWLQPHVRPRASGVLVRRMVVPVVSAALMVVFLLMSLFGGQPDVTNLSLFEAITRDFQHGGGGLDAMQFFVAIAQTADRTIVWALQNGVGGADSGWTAVLAWTVWFILSGMFIWAWVRVLVGADALFGSSEGTEHDAS
jgi:hypothetical protein